MAEREADGQAARRVPERDAAQGGVGRVRAQANGTRARADDPAAAYLGASAPPISLPAWKRRLFIDRPSDLAVFVAEAREAHVLALDAEFTETPHRQPTDPSHRLALLQFAFDNDYRASYVVDALRLADLSPLQELLGRANTLKLFHGMSADTRVLATRGLVARHTLDLEAVSRSLFGARESSLKAMLLRATGAHMDKSLQRADWAKRPLTPAMVAYAARDAEMTYALYLWLSANYPDQVARYTTPATTNPPDIAAWVLASLEGGRAYSIEDAAEDAGLTDDLPAQEVALRQALNAVQQPSQRARIIRFIGDLALIALTPDVRPYLVSISAEERASAARALGKLRDASATDALRGLLQDPTPDVRQAATNALSAIASGAEPRLPYRRALRRFAAPDTQANSALAGDSPAPPVGRREREASGAAPRIWTSGPTADDAEAEFPGDWRAALRARFGAATGNEPPDNIKSMGSAGDSGASGATREQE